MFCILPSLTQISGSWQRSFLHSKQQKYLTSHQGQLLQNGNPPPCHHLKRGMTGIWGLAWVMRFSCQIKGSQAAQRHFKRKFCRIFLPSPLSPFPNPLLCLLLLYWLCINFIFPHHVWKTWMMVKGNQSFCVLQNHIALPVPCWLGYYLYFCWFFVSLQACSIMAHGWSQTCHWIQSQVRIQISFLVWSLR